MKKRHNNRNAQQDRSGKGKVKNLGNDKSQEGGRVIKEKFMEERKARFPPLTAKNDNQKKAFQALATKQCVVLSGSSGVGKSTLAVWHACKLFNEGKIDNIVFTRGEKGLGATPPTPGNDTEKNLVMCLPMLLRAKQFLGAPVLKNNLRMQDIDFLFGEISGIMVFPMAKLGGMSFDSRTVIICDEAQAAEIAQIKALATRPEGGCQVIICGDTTQTPLKGREDGLSYLERKMMENPYEDSEVIKFTPSDSCRDGWSAHITAVFEEDGVW